MRPARQSALACSMRSLRRRDEIPFDEARADRLAAEQHHRRVLDGRERDRLAGREHEHLPCAELASLDLAPTR